MSRFRPSRNYVSGKVVFEGGPVEIEGDLVVTGSVTANEYNVNVINTSVTHIDMDGSTKFGDSADDTHVFTGSVFVVGALSASSIIGGGSTSPGGLDTYVQFNDGGIFGGDSEFIWNKTSNVLTVTGDITASANVSGAFFYGDGSNLTNLPGGSPGGANTQIQFNDDAAFAGDADFTWSTGSNTLTVTGDISGSGNISGSFFYGDASNLTNLPIPTTNTLYVDKSGNDATGAPDSIELPYLTIAAALGAASAGDVVLVRAGTYTESGLTVPADISLFSIGGFNATIIGDATAGSAIITLSDGSIIQGFGLIVPTSSGIPALTHTAGTATVYDLNFIGDGATGAGDGIYKTGTGKIVGANIRCSLGGMTSILRVDSGVLALDDVHVPNSAGSIANVVLTEGTGRFQGQGINIGKPTVTDCIHVDGTSTCIIYSPNWFNVPIGGHIASDGVTVTIVGGRIDCTVASLLVDGGLVGTGTTVTVSGTTIQPLFSFPAAAIGTMELNVTILQEETSTRNSESRVLGTSFVTGFPEVGSGATIGEGSSYSDGIKVITTDGTETMVGSVVTGGSQTDVTSNAKSRSSSSLTFQGTGVGNAIYLSSSRTDPSAVELKHWGVLINQLIAGVGGSYVVEIWDGASWLEVGTQATAQVETYRYSNELFLRASSNEFIQYGIDSDTTWALVTADTVGTAIGPSYWVRWRITGIVTTLPTFELVWLSPSFANLNDIGRRRAMGLALWRKTLIQGGNVYGETGGVQAANIAVGSGGLPTGWTQNAPNSRLNSTADAIYTQLVLPDGLCTAFPLNITVVYSVTGGQPVTLAPTGIVSVLPVEVEGVSVADPAGGLVPVARTLANTETLTAKAGTAIGPTALTDLATTNNRAIATDFGPFDINGYYEGDLIFIRFELENDGTPNQDVTVWTIILNGVAFSDGGTL